MTIKRLAALACIGLMAAQNVAAQTDEDLVDDRWYVTVFGGWSGLDDDREGIDNDAIFGLGLGRFLTTNFSVDLELDYINADITAPGTGVADDFEMVSLGLIGRYHLLGPDNKARPYLLGGFGGTDHSSDLSSSTDLYFTAGAGVRFEFNDNLSARVQAAYRYDSDDVPAVRRDGFDDVLVTAGLTYAFGAKKKPAPPPQRPQPPPPKPAPKPAPPPPPAPDGDDDTDGVRNSRDKCPETKRGEVVNLSGCEAKDKIDLPGVNFEFDSAKLTPDSLAILNEAVALLKHHSQITVEVAGHTDSVGTEAYNQGLSERRAQSVRDYLVDHGVSADRLTVKGYGESQPVASNETDAGRAKNRRTELVIKSR